LASRRVLERDAMKARQIKDIAILVGLSPDGKCVYSAILSLEDYWDGEHVSDTGSKVKKLRLEKLKGVTFQFIG
jgi:hypothetical protein